VNVNLLRYKKIINGTKVTLLSCKQILLALFLLGVLVPQVQAEWIQATGQAVIHNGKIAQAREAARKDALQEAAMKYGSTVESQQQVVNGKLVKDSLHVRSRAKVRHVEILDEKQKDGLLKIVINAELVDVNRCSASQANGYRKKVAIVGFSMLRPLGAALGDLYNVERALPDYLGKQLSGYRNLRVYASSQLRFYNDSMNAPTSMTRRKTLTQAVQLASKMGVQFIVSGTIRDMSVSNPDTFKESRWLDMARFLNLKDKRRHFVFDLYIHDGYSGELIYQKQYETIGKWSAPVEDKVRFASPEFWDTGYGKAVKTLIKESAADVEDSLRCQPFMTRITRVDGRNIQFDSGANSGIRPGDRLGVYRTFHLYMQDYLESTQLTNVKAELTVSQVFPGFSTGKIMVDASRLNIQPDDLLIAW